MASFALWFIWYRLISTQNQHLSVRNNITQSSLALQRNWETYFDTAIDVLRQLINILSKCLYWSYIWAPSHLPGLHSRVCIENLNFDGYSHFVNEVNFKYFEIKWDPVIMNTFSIMGHIVNVSKFMSFTLFTFKSVVVKSSF